MKQKVTHNFDAYFESNSKVLILGSIPSIKSRELGFYYMHPKNRFWSVISKVFNEEYPKTIDDKKSFLKRNKIALWDVVKSCEIYGSSDSSISNVVSNDIHGLLNKTNIKKVFVTGKKALELYQKYIFPNVRVEALYLPSTSPANAKLKEEDLVEKYQVLRSDVE